MAIIYCHVLFSTLFYNKLFLTLRVGTFYLNLVYNDNKIFFSFNKKTKSYKSKAFSLLFLSNNI